MYGRMTPASTAEMTSGPGVYGQQLTLACDAGSVCPPEEARRVRLVAALFVVPVVID